MTSITKQSAVGRNIVERKIYKVDGNGALLLHKTRYLAWIYINGQRRNRTFDSIDEARTCVSSGRSNNCWDLSRTLFSEMTPEDLAARFSVTSSGLLIRNSTSSAVGTTSDGGYLITRLGGKSVGVHRIVFALCNGEWAKGQVDHINGVRTDNRPENLRDVSRVLQSRNRAKIKKIGCTGVRLHKYGKWEAMISYKNENQEKSKSKYLGLHLTQKEACDARNEFIHAHPELGFTSRHGGDCEHK